MAAVALLAAGAIATPIRDREGGTAPLAATDLAADAAWDARGVPAAGGGVELAIHPTVVPEPTTIVLVSLGLAGLALSGRRRRV